MRSVPTGRNGSRVVVEDAVSSLLAGSVTEGRPNPYATGFVRSNSCALRTRDTTFAVPDVFPVGGVAWPEALLTLWKTVRYSSLTGVFASLWRAWFTVDNRLVLWDYRGGREFSIYDEIPELISVVGTPFRPVSGVFQPHVTHILPVATTSIVFFLGLCVVGEEDRSEIKIVNLGYSCVTEAVVTKMIGSNGRVFCAAADGHLYEVKYMRENTPITPKIRMVRHGHWLSSTPVLGQLTSAVTGVWESWRGGTQGGLVDLMVDERDGILATLSERSTIGLWRVQPNGDVRHLLSLRHRPDRLLRAQVSSHGEVSPLMRLFAIEADAQGCRLMAVALNGDKFRYRYLNLLDSIYGAELVLQSHTPSYLSTNKEIGVCYASGSFFMAAFSDIQDERASDEVIAATSPPTVIPPHQNVRDVVTSFSGTFSRIVRVDAIEWVPFTPRSLGASDLRAQVCSPGPTFVVVHRHGLSFFTQARPVDTLYLILSTSDTECRESLLSRFTSAYKASDYAAMLLQIAVGALQATEQRPLPFAKDMTLSGNNEGGAPLHELGQLLYHAEDAEVPRKACEILRSLQLPAVQAAPPQSPADAEVQRVVVLLSPFATGLVAFLARTLSTVWDVAVSKVQQSSVPPVTRVLEKLLHYLDSLSLGALSEEQRVLDFSHEWRFDEAVVLVPRGRSLRMDDVRRLQAIFLHHCYELARKAWQAATLLQRVLCVPLYSEDVSVTFAQVIRDPAVAQRLGRYLSEVMLASQQGINNGSAARAKSFMKLQQQCPYFFSSISTQAYQLKSEIDDLTRGESLQAYTEAQVQKWAAEVGAHAASYWPSGALATICEQLRSMKREGVAIQLLLHAAAQMDPNNAALNIFFAEGCGQVSEQVRCSSAYAVHQTKTQVLELVTSTLESAWLTHRSVVDDLLGGPRRSGSIWQVEPADEYAHCFLFDWMCAPRDDNATARSLRETLVTAQSPFVASYLRRNAEVLTEEYARYLAEVQGNHEAAMQQCLVMAQAPLSSIAVADRLSYRLRCMREALASAKKCRSDQTQQVEQQLRLLEAQQRLYRIATAFISSGNASLDRRLEMDEGQIFTERDIALQHIEFLSSSVASASDLIEMGGMYAALGGAEVQLDALVCSNVTDPAVYATCLGRAYENQHDTADSITGRLVERYFHATSCFPLSYLVQLLEARAFAHSPMGSPHTVQLLVGLGVDAKLLFLTYEGLLKGKTDVDVECEGFLKAGVTQGYLVYSYATVLLCLADLGRRGSVQQWLVSNAMSSVRNMIQLAARQVQSPSEKAAVERAEDLLRRSNDEAAGLLSMS